MTTKRVSNRGERRCTGQLGSEFARNAREVTTLIGQLGAADLTAADRAILRGLLRDLDALLSQYARFPTADSS